MYNVHWPVLKFAFTFFAYINSSHRIIKTLNHLNLHFADEYRCWQCEFHGTKMKFSLFSFIGHTNLAVFSWTFTSESPAIGQTIIMKEVFLEMKIHTLQRLKLQTTNYKIIMVSLCGSTSIIFVLKFTKLV